MAKGEQASREWPPAYHPGDEQEFRMSSHAQAKETTRAVAVARASTGLTNAPAGRRKGASQVPRLVKPARWSRSREPVCEPHDSTGEPGAGDRPAGFGERGEETYHGSRPAARSESGRKSHRPPPVTRLPSTPTRIGSVPFSGKLDMRGISPILPIERVDGFVTSSASIYDDTILLFVTKFVAFGEYRVFIRQLRRVPISAS